MPPAGRIQRAPLTSRAGGGRGEAATGFGVAETTSALVGSSVLAYDAASTYWTYWTGKSYQGPVLTKYDILAEHSLLSKCYVYYDFVSVLVFSLVLVV